MRTDPNTLNKPGHIKWFDDLGTGNEKYRWASNFYAGQPLTFPWLADPEEIFAWTNEAHFAAWKTDNLTDFLRILTERDPGKAKTMGRTVHLRPDWEEIKYDAMMYGLRLKFTLAREEGQLLLNTGTALLQEGTFWHDPHWGTILQEEGEPGRNWLGTMLMARRAELQAETEHGATHDTAAGNLKWLLSRKHSAFLTA